MNQNSIVSNKPTSEIRKVSVVIPVFNGQQFLESSLHSVFQQRFFGEVECIVVDDGSTDRSLEIAQSFESARVISQKNAGPSAARNRGFEVSTGEAVVFQDADDVLCPQSLEWNVSLLNANPELGVVAGQCKGFSNDEELAIPGPLEAVLPSIVEHRSYHDLLRGHAFVPPATLMFRREVIEEIQGFRGPAPGEDLDLYLRASRRAAIGVHEGLVVYYRRHTGNVSNDPASILSGLLDLLARYELEEQGDQAALAAIAAGRHHWIQLFAPRLLMNAVWQAKRLRLGAAARSLLLLSKLKLSG